MFVQGGSLAVTASCPFMDGPGPRDASRAQGSTARFRFGRYTAGTSACAKTIKNIERGVGVCCSAVNDGDDGVATVGVEAVLG